MTNEFDIMGLEVEEPKTSIDDYSWTIYGEAGIGKSSICAHLFPDPAYFQWENNQGAIRAKKIPVDNWKTFKGYTKTLMKAFAEGKPMPMKSAIMDTADFAWKKCTEYVCKMNGWGHPSDGEWGKGWDAVSVEFEMEMANLENIGIKPVFISHDKDKEFKPKKGEKYNQTLPAVPTGCIATIVDKVNMVVYCAYEKITNESGEEEKVRRMYFRTNGDYVAKSHLLYMTDFVDFGDTPKESADRVISAFYEAVEKEFGEGAEKNTPPASTTGKGSKTAKTDKAEKSGKADKTDKANKTSKKDEKPVEEPKAKEPEKTPETAPEQTGEPENEMTLDQIKSEVEKILKGKLSAKEMTAVQVVKAVEDNTGKKKIADIDDIEKAKALLNAIKG